MGWLFIMAVDFPIAILYSGIAVLKVLDAQLIADDLHISNGINLQFNVDDLFVLECTHYVVYSIHLPDVR